MACFDPRIASKVRCTRWSRHWVSTWMVTSSGMVPLDEPPHEVVVGLARRWEPDLDLLVAHPHEQVEHPLLALRVHRVDERLVAVPRSTAHHRGAWVIRLVGQVRSEARRRSVWNSGGTCRTASPRGSGGGALLSRPRVRWSLTGPQPGTTNSATREAECLGLVAAARRRSAERTPRGYALAPDPSSPALARPDTETRISTRRPEAALVPCGGD